jgi:hypothetical protein
VLGFTGAADDILDYQRRRFGYAPPLGEVAVLELSPFAATGSASCSPHRFTFQRERVAAIRTALRAPEIHPKFAVFYGTTQRVAFGDIVDGFDAHGFAWVGTTLCALVRHPTARGPRRDWRELGAELRDRIESGSLESR